MLASWLPYLAGSVGLTVILVLSHIAWPIRYHGCLLLKAMGLKLPCPLYCSMCSGVWIGSAFGALKIVLSHGGWQVILVEPCAFVFDAVTLGLATSVVSYVITTWLRSKGEVTEPKHDQEKANAYRK